jgi:hypothetical protein
MELTVMDRLLLLGLLPAEGDITTLRIVRKLREDLSFSEQEHADLKLKQEDGRVTWEPTGAAPKDITIGLKGVNLIVHALKKLSDEKKLGPQHLDLYDQFVANDEE